MKRCLTKLWLFALVLAAGASLPADPAAAAYPGHDGKIAYTDGGGGLWTARRDGSFRRAIIRRRAVQNPVWSPDGRKLAFSIGKATNFFSREIYTADAAGKHIRRLTHNSAADLFPAWSPDGRYLASVRDVDVGGFAHREVWVMTAFGRREHKLVDAGFGSIAWSPRGTQLAFPGPDGDLEVVDPRGGAARTVIDEPAGASAGAISWSPSGDRLALMEYRYGPCDDCSSLAEVRSDGSSFRQLDAGRRFGTGSLNPVWSPSGGTIRYCRQRAFGSFVAASVRPDGTEARDLKRVPCAADWQPRPRA